MASIAAFILVAILHGSDDSFSITQIATFENEAACQEASDAIETALETASTMAVEIGCIPQASIDALKGH